MKGILFMDTGQFINTSRYTFANLALSEPMTLITKFRNCKNINKRTLFLNCLPTNIQVASPEICYCLLVQPNLAVFSNDCCFGNIPEAAVSLVS